MKKPTSLLTFQFLYFWTSFSGRDLHIFDVVVKGDILSLTCYAREEDAEYVEEGWGRGWVVLAVHGVVGIQVAYPQLVHSSKATSSWF